MWEKWKKNPDHFSPDMLAFRMNNVSYIHEYKGDTFLHLAVDGLLGGDVYKRKERVLKLLHLAKNHYFEEGKDFIFAFVRDDDTPKGHKLDRVTFLFISI